MKQWQIDIEVDRRSDKLSNLPIEKQKKLIYEWTKTGLISYTVFDILLQMILERNS
jgi:hypothetical protein